MTEIEPIDVVLGELTEAQRAEAETLMRDDPEFRSAVERLSPTAAKLQELPDEAWQDLEPPPPPRIAVPDLEPAKPARPARRRGFFLRPALAAGLAAVILAIGVGAGALLLGSDDGSPDAGEEIALAPFGEGEPGESGTVKLANDTSDVTISVDGLKPSAEGEFYEAWLLSETDEVVSLGGFRVGEDGTGELEAELPDDPGKYRYFDVSVERADGDATHSGRSILRAGTTPS